MTPGPVHQPGRRRWSTHSTDPTSPGAPPHFLSAFHSVRRPALASRTCGRYRGRPPGDPGASKAEESNPKRPPQISAARQRTAAQRQPGRRTRGSAEIRVRHVLPEPSPPPRAPARRRPFQGSDLYARARAHPGQMFQRSHLPGPNTTTPFRGSAVARRSWVISSCSAGHTIDRSTSQSGSCAYATGCRSSFPRNGSSSSSGRGEERFLTSPRRERDARPSVAHAVGNLPDGHGAPARR